MPLLWRFVDAGGQVINKGLFSSASVHWATPPDLYAALDAEFHFNDDPCPESDNGIEGLLRAWGTSTFVNPPYGRQIGFWTMKGYQESLLGKTCVFLVPARTDPVWFQTVFRQASEILFIAGRVKFSGSEQGAPFPSALLLYGKGTLKPFEHLGFLVALPSQQGEGGE